MEYIELRNDGQQILITLFLNVSVIIKKQHYYLVIIQQTRSEFAGLKYPNHVI